MEVLQGKDFEDPEQNLEVKIVKIKRVVISIKREKIERKVYKGRRRR